MWSEVVGAAEAAAAVDYNNPTAIYKHGNMMWVVEIMENYANAGDISTK